VRVQGLLHEHIFGQFGQIYLFQNPFWGLSPFPATLFIRVYVRFGAYFAHKMTRRGCFPMQNPQPLLAPIPLQNAIAPWETPCSSEVGARMETNEWGMDDG